MTDFDYFFVMLCNKLVLSEDVSKAYANRDVLLLCIQLTQHC